MENDTFGLHLRLWSKMGGELQDRTSPYGYECQRLIKMNTDIQFKWEDCVAKDGSSFKFSKIQFEGVNFGISLGKALETKEG